MEEQEVADDACQALSFGVEGAEGPHPRYGAGEAFEHTGDLLTQEALDLVRTTRVLQERETAFDRSENLHLDSIPRQLRIGLVTVDGSEELLEVVVAAPRPESREELKMAAEERVRAEEVQVVLDCRPARVFQLRRHKRHQLVGESVDAMAELPKRPRIGQMAVLLHPRERIRELQEPLEALRQELQGQVDEVVGGTERPGLWQGLLTIRRGVLRRHVVRAKRFRIEHLAAGSEHVSHEYVGTLRLEGAHVVLGLHATNHSESTVSRYPRWLPSSGHLVVGIWLGRDHVGTPAAGTTLLSKIELDSDEAKELLRTHAQALPGLLRVRQSPKGRGLARRPVDGGTP